MELLLLTSDMLLADSDDLESDGGISPRNITEDVDMDDLEYLDEDCNQASPAKKRTISNKGKQKATSVPLISNNKKGKEKAGMTIEERARQRREERKHSLHARRPVIVLRKDSGWNFSQDAFVSDFFSPLTVCPNPSVHLSDVCSF